MHCCSLKTTIEKHRVITSIIVAPVVHNSLCNNIGHRLLDFFYTVCWASLTWGFHLAVHQINVLRSRSRDL